MIKAISNILSYVFHPLLMPTLIIALMQYTNPFLFVGFGFSGISPLVPVFLFTFVYPVIAILLLKKLDFIDSIKMPDSKQRIVPLIIAIVLYIWTYMVLQSKNFPPISLVFMIGVVISLCLSFVINVFHKLSLHMVGASGALTIIMLMMMASKTDMSYWFLGAIILVGAIATARLYLQAHTMKEVYTGFLVGMFGQVLGLLFLY